MLQTFEAKLKGNQLEWVDEMPKQVYDRPRSIYVYVTLREKVDSETLRKQRLAEALDKLAAMDAVADITDPVAWLCCIREDRPLLFRE